VASFVLNAFRERPGLTDLEVAVLPWMVVILALLMVSKVKYDTLPKISRRAIRKEPWKFVFSLLAVIVVAITGGSAIFYLLVLFILLGLVRYLVSWFRRVGKHSQPRYDEDDVPEPGHAES
jgi:CDP-diacylglycerol--serine O-phosphatidyltransferase